MKASLIFSNSSLFFIVKDGASSAAPAYWLGQNAWMSQTIGQNYQDQLAQAYYGQNRTSYGAADDQMLPNKQVKS